MIGKYEQKMSDLTSKQRKYLRAAAHHIDPVVLIGKNGFYEGASIAIDNALNIHELIKIKFREFKDERKDIGIQISKELNCNVVGQVGYTLILYRYNSKLEKHIFKLPAC
jgi:RNA-binding protein|tara:strand:+ start:70 stop:399 length:330 start_codon:yes stop_codon:yes gene_type:complete